MSRPVEGDATERQKRHLAAIESLIDRDRINISGKHLVYLLAHLQANLRFQREAIRGLASVAAGETDWEALDKMIETAELSQDILEKFIFELPNE